MSQTLHTPSWSEPDQPEAAMSPFKRFAALPEAAGRLQILKIHVAGMPLGSDVDLERLAAATRGRSCLENRCRSAFRRLSASTRM